MWPGLGDLIKSATTYVTNKVRTGIVNLSNRLINETKEKINDVASNTTVSPYISVSGTNTFGARVAGGFEKAGDIDVNMKSVELASFKVKNLNAEVNYTGKDDKVVFSFGLSYSIEAGASISSETTINKYTKNVVAKKSEMTTGFGVGIFNVSSAVVKEKITKTTVLELQRRDILDLDSQSGQ